MAAARQLRQRDVVGGNDDLLGFEPQLFASSSIASMFVPSTPV